MRIEAAIVISAQILATVANAQTLSEKAVSMLNEVCIAPSSSEGKVAAAERHAAKENWKLVRSEAAPMPFMHNENGVKNSFVTAWDFNLPGGSRAHLYISVLRPEPSDFRYTVCLIQPDIDLDSDDLARSIDRQFGSAVAEDMSGRFTDQKSWFFAAEKSKGNCGKQIYFSLNRSSNRGKPKTLIFTDFVYPNDSPIAKSTWCPR
ncbi:hypothetical protein [Bradyrhizobium sp. 1(2017)]|uniref:hypothetical protein n=1 Tax=Bradyrhizobium sp. 1(2017) TaxID=1404888 RepID=UPI00140F0483|nr:hypothetical protein [Bradyrhizobium sp. 1(2017)]QIO31380.1 hypothetical protein HAP40_05855 [Bradyrhizobium sp. 1(2017)]